MVRLIVGVLILILIGVLFALNTARTDINLFGYQMQDVPVIAVAIAGFVLGVLYSFILYFMRFVARRRKASLSDRDRAVRDRERTLQDREKRLETLEEGLEDSGLAPGGAADAAEEGPRGRRRRR